MQEFQKRQGLDDNSFESEHRPLGWVFVNLTWAGVTWEEVVRCCTEEQVPPFSVVSASETQGSCPDALTCSVIDSDLGIVRRNKPFLPQLLLVMLFITTIESQGGQYQSVPLKAANMQTGCVYTNNLVSPPFPLLSLETGFYSVA